MQFGVFVQMCSTIFIETDINARHTKMFNDIRKITLQYKREYYDHRGESIF